VKLVIFAVVFLAVLVVFFIRERRFWKKSQETRKALEDAVPKWISRANGLHQRKYGRPADSLTNLTHASAGKNHRS
jgi:hypothetical protein